MTTAGAKATVNNSGTVVVADDAEDGAMDLSVSFAGKTLHVSVEVATPARYEALLSTASVNDAGESEEPRHHRRERKPRRQLGRRARWIAIAQDHFRHHHWRSRHRVGRARLRAASTKLVST